MLYKIGVSPYKTYTESTEIMFLIIQDNATYKFTLIILIGDSLAKLNKYEVAYNNHILYLV